MSKLKIAVQKSGRLSEKSLKLLDECGIKISNGARKLKAEATNFPVEILFLRDDDIPQYVEQGVADVGILGENEVWEKDKKTPVVEKLGFANCRMALAVQKNTDYKDLSFFEGKKIATGYPNILKKYLDKNNVNCEIEVIGGSVEIATGIGLADGIFDIVSTGSTLLMNGLKEVEQVTKSQAVLIKGPKLSAEKNEILEKLSFRIKAAKSAARNKYILLNAPNEAISKISDILPGMKSPTILPLAQAGWSSLHSVVKEDEFWDVIDQLKTLGAQGILVIPIEKMIL
jgi:ATP phosphoribosyltransferase